MITSLENLEGELTDSSHGNSDAHSSELKIIIERLKAILNIANSSYTNIKNTHSRFTSNIQNINSNRLNIVNVDFLNKPTKLINDNINIISDINNYKRNKSGLNFNLEVKDFIINKDYLNTLNNIFILLNNNNNISNTLNEVYYHLKIESSYLNRPRVTSENNMYRSKRYLEFFKNDNKNY